MIHVFSILEMNLVLDVASGSLHLVDDDTYKVLKHFNKFFSYKELKKEFADKISKSKLDEIYDEIQTLYFNNTLYTVDNFKKIYDKRNYKNLGLKAMCLNVSHDCNLRCQYCFASKGTYKSKREVMTPEIGIKALEYLASNSGKRKNIEVDFFGGEPLMNFDAIKEIVEYGRSIEDKYNKRFHFTVTTNGTLFTDEIIDYINENMDNVVISIDGRKEVHDSMRPYPSKEGSYEKILKDTKKLIEKRSPDKSYFIRGTFTSRNLDFANDYLHINELGFNEISIEPVVGSGQKFHITQDDLNTIMNEYERLLEILIKNGKNNFYHFNAKLYDGPCLYKRVNSCGAGYEYFAVSPAGKIYPCHQFDGEDEFVMGNVDNGIENTEMSEYFYNSNIFGKEDCKKCWARYFCSGGCHANSYFGKGDIRKIDSITCEMQKKRIECALLLEANKHIAKENDVSKLERA